MGPQVDRARLVSWLVDKARDEDELAGHQEASSGDVAEAAWHRERASFLRRLAAGVETGEPDAFQPPDLARRGSGEHRLDLPPR